MNDIHEANENFQAILYADDTSLFSSLGSFNVALNGNNFDKCVLSTNINNELSKIQEWLNINKLSLNVSKTKHIIFHYHQRSIDSLIPDITINHQSIERVSEFKILGLTIDENLSWNAHIQKLSKLPNQLGFWLDWNATCRLIFSEPYTVHLFCRIFKFLYWIGGFKANRITRLQKRAIRVITNSKYNEHVEPLSKQLNLLKVSDIFHNSLLKLFYK